MADERVTLLESFILENDELEELEGMLVEFNIFQVLGITSREIKHSNMLAWLMDPNETHSIGDYFLKNFLMKAAARASESQITIVSPIDIDVWDLGSIMVSREWQNIDILLVSKTKRFVCVVENKIFSTDHNEQLSKYRKFIESQYPGYERMFILLSPTGFTPTEEEEIEHYITMSYSDVLSSLDKLLKVKQSILSQDVKVLLENYKNVIRRYIMQDSKIQELAEAIYRKHKLAIDTIIEYIPDTQLLIKNYLVELIETHAGHLNLDVSIKPFIRFSTDKLDSYSDLSKGDGWTSSKRILLFEFQNSPNKLDLSLIIGPGDEEIRKKIHTHATANKSVFRNSGSKLTRFKTIYKMSILKEKDFKGADTPEELKAEIEKQFNNFMTTLLPKIHQEIDKLELN